MTRRLPAGWDWILGYTLIGLAGVALLITSVEVSGSRFISDQLADIVSGGLGGLVLLGLGAVLVVTAGLGDEWRKLDRVESALPFPSLEPPNEPSAVLRRSRIVAGLGLLVPAAVLVPTWWTVSGDADPKPGLGALTWAVVVLVIGALVAALATVRVQRGMQRRKRRLFAPWALPASGATAPKVSGALDPGVGSVLVVPELSRFHRPGCPAVGGLAARSLDPRDIPTHLEPCDLCEADAIVREERTWTSVAG